MLKFSNNLINSNKAKTDETKEDSVDTNIPVDESKLIITNGNRADKNDISGPAVESNSRITFSGMNTSDNRLKFSGTSAAKVKTGLVTNSVPPSSKVAINNEVFSQYAKFKDKKVRLAGYIKEASLMLDELNMDAFTEKLKKLGDKVSSDSFKVQIVGTFKNGKSTFINSFLGESVLPAYALPCTAVINEVKYGEKKRAVLHFKNPLPKVLPKELSPVAVKHMQKHGMKNIPPMEIPYDKIEHFVVIPMGKEPKDMLLESPYEKVELYWPLELLKNGIEIIDSPGLNEHATRTKVTMDYISKADAVIFVLNATTLCSMDEMSFIEKNLKAQGFEDLFFVVNRFDLIPDNEKKRVIQYARLKLSEFTNFKEKGIFFVSAKTALDAKVKLDTAKLKVSGLPVFEKALSDFLTKNIGKYKLITPARELKKIVKNEALNKIIPRQYDILKSSEETLNEKYNEIKPKLDKLEEKKRNIYKKMLEDIKLCKKEFVHLAKRNTEELTGYVPMWINSYVPTTKLGLFPNKAKVRTIIDEISAFVSVRLEQSSADWQEGILVPEMKRKAKSIFSDAEFEIREIIEELNRAGDEVVGRSIDSAIGTTANTDYNLSLLQEIKGDSSRITKSAAMRTAGEALVLMLSLASPVALIGAITLIFVGVNHKSETAAIKKLKDSVISEVTSNLQSTSDNFVNTVAEGVTATFKEIADKMMEPVDNEISEIKKQIEVAIADRKSGEYKVDEKKKALSKKETDLKTLCTLIDRLAMEVIGK